MRIGGTITPSSIAILPADHSDAVEQVAPLGRVHETHQAVADLKLHRVHIQQFLDLSGSFFVAACCLSRAAAAGHRILIPIEDKGRPAQLRPAGATAAWADP